MPATKQRQIIRELVDADLTPEEQMLEEARKENEADSPLPEPIDYYNPWCPYEKFRLPGTAEMVRFMAGRFQVHTVMQQQIVREILMSHIGARPIDPDSLSGNDKQKPWVCKQCGFTASNDLAVDLHRDRGF